MLERHPWRVQATNTAVLLGSSDFLVQTLILKRRKTSEYDFPRTLRYFGAGLLVFGPSMHFWYRGLDRYITGAKTVVVAKKLAWDQLFFLPLYLGSFVALMEVLQLKKPKEVRKELRKEFGKLLMVSYCVWPPVQLFNFAFAPGIHRVLVINVVNLLWTMYLNYRIENKKPNMTPC